MKRVFSLLTAGVLSFSALTASAVFPRVEIEIQDIGLFAGSDYLPEDYALHSKVKDVYARHKGLRSDLPQELPADMEDLARVVHRYIEDVIPRGVESKNKILNSQLARKIVRASFCFGTDPFVVAGKIRMESVFDRSAVSPTGAVGLSQMTGIAIDEVNDQLGNRGDGYAPAENKAYLNKAIDCYLGQAFRPMWADGICKGRACGRDLTNAKKWIVSQVDRDLIYGQIVLKVNLAAERSGRASMEKNYWEGLVRYNGDRQKIKGREMRYIYADKVMSYYRDVVRGAN